MKEQEMAISGFGRGKGNETGTTSAPPPAAAPARSSSSSGFGNLTAFIDQGSEFEGKLSFKDTVRIDGTFRGEISSENTLIVGESGEIQATIHSRCVVISGHVVGDVNASASVTLHKTAVVEGDLCTPSLMVEEGAKLDGVVKMKSAGSGSNGNLKAISGGGDQTTAKGASDSDR